MQLNLFLYIAFYSKYFGCNTRFFFPLQSYTALWLLTITQRQWKLCFISCECTFSPLVDWELGSKKWWQCQKHQDLPDGQCLHPLSPLQLTLFPLMSSDENQLWLRASDHPIKHFREHIVFVDLYSQSAEMGTPYLGRGSPPFPAQAAWDDKVCHVEISLKCLEVDATSETRDPDPTQTLSCAFVVVVVGPMMPLLHARAGVRRLEGNSTWRSHNTMDLFLGQTNPGVTRHTTNMYSLFWMLPDAAVFVFLLIRHWKQSNILISNRKGDCLQCTYAQGMEFKQVFSEIPDVFARQVKAVHRVKTSSDS